MHAELIKLPTSKSIIIIMLYLSYLTTNSYLTTVNSGC